MGSYISNRNACAHTWSLFNDDRCLLSENRTRMSRSNLSRKALVSADARARPVIQGAAFEAQISLEPIRRAVEVASSAPLFADKLLTTTGYCVLSDILPQGEQPAHARTPVQTDQTEKDACGLGEDIPL